ncbi:hypothetical protein BGZ99_008130 [Dissophora globulifera]|uniref:Uncharacterized protein n=1 Tax=Dissophora globulifera TaxID=979702 RepID=A0A9P6UNV7_9FUNG|nr:hypothetical protein BGZ99_008130 [Dissophora globulifera]
MDALREFHRTRIRTRLRTRTASADDADDAASPASSAVAKALAIPELVSLVANFVPPRSWPAMSQVSKSFLSAAQPLMWKTITCSRSSAFDQIHLFLHKNAHLVYTLDLTALDQGAMWELSQDLPISSYPNLTSLSLYDCSFTAEQLTGILGKLPRLRSIDIRTHQRLQLLNLHPLHILSPWQQLESIAFTQDSVKPPPVQRDTNIFQSWPRLRKLHIASWVLGEVQGSLLLLQDLVLSSFVDLESLTLETVYGWGGTTLQHMIKNSHRLCSLALMDCDFSGSSLASISSTLSRLVSLKIHFCENISQQDLTCVIQASPYIHCLDISMVPLGVGISGQHAVTHLSLTLLSLTGCVLSFDILKEVVIQCRGLLRLRVETIHGPGSVSTLFEGKPWRCRNLEELVLEGMQWRSHEFKDEELRRKALIAMWSTLAGLKRLRVLTLTHQSSLEIQSKAYGWEQLVALSRLEQLCLMGDGKWRFEDVLCISENFPWLEQLRYLDTEMSTPLWAWLRRNRPDVRLLEADP